MSNLKVEVPVEGLFYFKEMNPPRGYVKLQHLKAFQIEQALNNYNGAPKASLWDYDEIKSLTINQLANNQTEEKGLFKKYLDLKKDVNLMKANNIGRLFFRLEPVPTSPILLHLSAMNSLFFQPSQKQEHLSSDNDILLTNLSAQIQNPSFSKHRRKIAEYCYNLAITYLYEGTFFKVIEKHPKFFDNITTYLENKRNNPEVKHQSEDAENKVMAILRDRNRRSSGLTLYPKGVGAHAEVERLQEARSQRLREARSPKADGMSTREIMQIAISNTILETVGVDENDTFYDSDSAFSKSACYFEKEIADLVNAGRTYVTTDNETLLPQLATDIVTKCQVLATKTNNSRFLSLALLVIGWVIFAGAVTAIGLLSGVSCPKAPPGMVSVEAFWVTNAAMTSVIGICALAVGTRQREDTKEIAQLSNANIGFFPDAQKRITKVPSSASATPRGVEGKG